MTIHDKIKVIRALQSATLGYLFGTWIQNHSAGLFVFAVAYALFSELDMLKDIIMIRSRHRVEISLNGVSSVGEPEQRTPEKHPIDKHETSS